MAMDSLRNPQCGKTLVVYAIDPAGRIGGFLQFVPTYGRDAVSLSLMRRRHDTPNGLTEFMIVKAIEELRGPRHRRGLAQLRGVRTPLPRARRRVRADGRPGDLLGDSWFQIERLYRFNAKFFPRWEPRYFMYERRFGLPRAGIAALWLEGQLPKPAFRSTRRAA